MVKESAGLMTCPLGRGTPCQSGSSRTCRGRRLSGHRVASSSEFNNPASTCENPKVGTLAHISPRSHFDRNVERGRVRLGTPKASLLSDGRFLLRLALYLEEAFDARYVLMRLR
jgi:hypothetical protein